MTSEAHGRLAQHTSHCRTHLWRSSSHCARAPWELGLHVPGDHDAVVVHEDAVRLAARLISEQHTCSTTRVKRPPPPLRLHPHPRPAAHWNQPTTVGFSSGHALVRRRGRAKPSGWSHAAIMSASGLYLTSSPVNYQRHRLRLASRPPPLPFCRGTYGALCSSTGPCLMPLPHACRGRPLLWRSQGGAQSRRRRQRSS
jgi:hypothetical protein